MKRALSSDQIEYHRDTATWVPKNEILTGFIDCQPGGWGGKPIMVIDGIKLSWDEFAQTVLTHEGFKFKLEFIDPTDKESREAKEVAKVIDKA